MTGEEYPEQRRSSAYMRVTFAATPNRHARPFRSR
jgi:hypothetical protein